MFEPVIPLLLINYFGIWSEVIISLGVVALIVTSTSGSTPGLDT